MKLIVLKVVNIISHANGVGAADVCMCVSANEIAWKIFSIMIYRLHLRK